MNVASVVVSFKVSSVKNLERCKTITERVYQHFQISSFKYVVEHERVSVSEERGM